MTIFCYPKCSTCKKAESWLKENNINYAYRDIKENNPSAEEIRGFLKLSNYPITKFFNTSGILYRELNLKEKLSQMTEDEMINLLATDGMLVKRPIVVYDGGVLVGFKEEEWNVLIK